MKVPDEYEPVQLIALLRSQGPQLRTHYFRPQSDLSYLIKCSVRGNTFRAFAHLALKPSEIFREWTHRYFTNKRIADLSTITRQPQYDQFLEAAVVDLTQAWSKRSGQQLKFGASRKLTNLLFKSLIRFVAIPDSARQVLIPLLHVPHDRFCFATIRRSANSGQFGASLRIPKNASMGFITSAPQYDAIQELMRRISTAADEPAITVDLVAWDSTH